MFFQLYYIKLYYIILYYILFCSILLYDIILYVYYYILCVSLYLYKIQHFFRPKPSPSPLGLGHVIDEPGPQACTEFPDCCTRGGKCPGFRALPKHESVICAPCETMRNRDK